jgi:hypothetical protein
MEGLGVELVRVQVEIVGVVIISAHGPSGSECFLEEGGGCAENTFVYLEQFGGRSDGDFDNGGAKAAECQKFK